MPKGRKRIDLTDCIEQFKSLRSAQLGASLLHFGLGEEAALSSLDGACVTRW